MEQVRADFFLRRRQTVLGHVESTNRAAVEELRELVQQEPATAPDLQNPCVLREGVERRQLARDDAPPAVVLVTAVAVPSVSVPVVPVEPSRNLGAMYLRVRHPAEVVAGRAAVQ